MATDPFDRIAGGPRACPDPQWSAPYVAAVCAASVVACFAMGAAVATHLYNRITGGQP